jgi:hypothetical protein
MKAIGILAGLSALLIVAAVEAYPISGKIGDGAYTNPEATFRVSVPALAGPHVRIIDGSPEPEVWQVEFSDDRCRRFVAAEHRSIVPPAEFDGWLNRVVVPGITDSGGEEVTVRRVGSAMGESALIEYWKPASAPCRVYDKVTSEDRLPMRMGSPGGARLRNEDEARKAGWTIWQPSARIALQLIAVEDRTYSLYYVIGEGITAQADWIGPPSLPLEARLGEFVQGFEIVR